MKWLLVPFYYFKKLGYLLLYWLRENSLISLDNALLVSYMATFPTGLWFLKNISISSPDKQKLLFLM